MDQEVFTKAYFKGLAEKLIPYGYKPETLVKAIWAGTGDMVKNDGGRTNEAVFWDKFYKIFGEGVKEHLPLFDEFYQNEFNKVKDVCGYNAEAKKTVDALKEKGFRVGLATNPIFPAVATRARIRWAGLKPEEFEFYTTYENSRYCKPSPDYYKNILDTYGISAKSCVMVGNDATEDTAAEKLGIKVFLLTDCLINKNGEDISRFAHGGFSELRKFFGI